MLRFCLTLLTAFFLTTTATELPAEGSWSGDWKAHNGKVMSLMQDGSRVWGDYGDTRLVEGNLSPDDKVFHGAWLYDDGRWGLMWFALNHEREGFSGYWTFNDAIPLDSSQRWWANRLSDTPQPLVYATGAGRHWPPELDFDAPGVRDFLTFDGAVPLGTGDTEPAEPENPQPDGWLNLGEWTVMGPGPARLGFVVVLQDRQTGLMSFEGRSQFERLDPDDAIPVEIRQLDGANAQVVARVPGAKSVVANAAFAEMEGDQYRLTIPPGDLTWQELTIHILARPVVDNRPEIGGPQQTGPYRLVDLPYGIAIELRTLPLRDASVKGYLASDTAGFGIEGCRARPRETWEHLRGDALTEALFDTFCLISVEGAGGWIGGNFITR